MISSYCSEALSCLSVGVFSVKGGPTFRLSCSYSVPRPGLQDVIFSLRGFLLRLIHCSDPNRHLMSMQTLVLSFPTDSDNSLLRYLSDDKILVIEEEPEGPGRESRRDSTRRSRRKSRNPSSPSFPISPSMLSSTLRLDQPPEPLPVRTKTRKTFQSCNLAWRSIYTPYSSFPHFVTSNTNLTYLLQF